MYQIFLQNPQHDSFISDEKSALKIVTGGKSVYTIIHRNSDFIPFRNSCAMDKTHCISVNFTWQCH